MPHREINIARDQTVLGILPENDARQLLEIGFLKETDFFWTQDMTEWKRLSELDAGKSKTQWLARARHSASTAASAVVGSAVTVTGKIKKLAMVQRVSAAESAAIALTGYMPHIKRILARLAETRPIQAVKSGMHDDNLMRKVFGAAYDCLPRPVCRFVSEQSFIEFCMQHRERLLNSQAAGKIE
jgi:hypothetical protein